MAEQDARADRQAFGQHVAWAEEDTFFDTPRGDISLTEMRQMLDLVEEIKQRQGRVFVITKVRELGAISPEARRMCAQWALQNPISAAAVVGASVATRALLTLVLRAMNLFHPKNMPVRFCSSEEEARLWVAEQRKRLFGGQTTG